MPKTKLVCITGLKGSGKSTVMNFLKQAGFKTFITDEWVHEIYKNGNIGYEKIKNFFGKQYVNENEVDRNRLGNLVFNDNKMLKKLNKITIPLIKQKLIELTRKNELIFVELAIYIYHYRTFNKLFNSVVLIERKKQKKSYIQDNNLSTKRFLPTFTVGKKSILRIKRKNKCIFNVVNSQNKLHLKKQIFYFIKNKNNHLY